METITEPKPLISSIREPWFSMILQGIKLEEYKEIKPYWISRLFKGTPLAGWTPGDFLELYHLIKTGKVKPRNEGQILQGVGFLDLPQTLLPQIILVNGYGEGKPRLTLDLDPFVYIKTPVWGWTDSEDQDRPVFALRASQTGVSDWNYLKPYQTIISNHQNKIIST